MKRIIADLQLIDYVNGRLNGSETKEIQTMALENGETDVLLNATLANYESQSEYADLLLGEDDFYLLDNSPFIDVSDKELKMAADKNFKKK